MRGQEGPLCPGHDTGVGSAEAGRRGLLGWNQGHPGSSRDKAGRPQAPFSHCPGCFNNIHIVAVVATQLEPLEACSRARTLCLSVSAPGQLSGPSESAECWPHREVSDLCGHPPAPGTSPATRGQPWGHPWEEKSHRVMGNHLGMGCRSEEDGQP